jgi:type I restriction enzyme M protein
LSQGVGHLRRTAPSCPVWRAAFDSLVRVITDELMRKIDRIWDAFWSGGVSSSVEIIEQITYLMFIRQLDEAQAQAEDTAAPADGLIYTDEVQALRWSRFTAEAPQNMLTTVRDGVFPWLRALGSGDSTFSRHMRDARFAIPTAGLLAKVVEILDGISSREWGDGGELYEYMLSKVTVGGMNGQFLTPRHIIQLIVEMMAPGVEDQICDPACGTAGFLVASAEYVNRVHHADLSKPAQRKQFNEDMFHGFDLDKTMLRIGAMNLWLHGVKKPDIRYRDSLAQSVADEIGMYSLILAHPPFAGSLDYESSARELQGVVKTKKTELLFLALFLRLLRHGGRAAIIVPDGVLFGSSKAHVDIRRILVEEHKLDAVVKLPKGVFKPYAGLSAAMLFFTKTNSGGTDDVWFYDMTADGWSLDDRRISLLAEDKLGPTPERALDVTEHAKNNLPDVLARWARRNGAERKRARTEQSFCVSKADISAQAYDLSLSRYRTDHESKKVQAGGGWRLGDVAQVIVGTVKSAEFEKSSDAIAERGRRVLHPSFLTSPLPDVEDLPVRAGSKVSKYVLREGDIVGRDLAGNRYWTVLSDAYDGVQPGQGVIVLRPIRDAVPSEYLVSYLSSPQAELQFPRYHVIPRIRPHDLSEIMIPLCDGDFESIRIAVAGMDEGSEEAGRIQQELHRSKMAIFEHGTGADRRIRLEQAADLGSLIAQNLRKQSEPYRVFQETYPYAIARAVRRFKHSLTAVEKHESAIQCVESLILSLGIVSLALSAQRGWRSLAESAKWAESVRHGGVSLGHWVGVIRAAGAFARESGDEAAGLAEATALKKGGKGLMADLGSLVSLRNNIRHGSGPRTRAEVEKSLEGLEQLMARSLSSSAFLAKMQWVHANQLRWLPKVGKYQISGLALMGDHPDFEPVEFKTEIPLEDDALYMFTRQGEVIPLSPFCILGDCPTCLTPELYYPDRLTNSTALLKSLDRGHELESGTVFEDLLSWIGP